MSKKKEKSTKANKYQKTSSETTQTKKKSPSEKKNPTSHQAWIAYKKERNADNQQKKRKLKDVMFVAKH